MPALLTLSIPGYEGRNLLLIAFLVLVVQSSDVMQYVWGKLLGRRKIAPELSPSKTWEGFVGGVGSAILIAVALYWITPFTPLQAAAMALVITLMGFFGGLVMSAIKRDRGVKDWGQLIEGHGGMLDRLDSVDFRRAVLLPPDAVFLFHCVSILTVRRQNSAYWDVREQREQSQVASGTRIGHGHSGRLRPADYATHVRTSEA